MCLTAFLCSEPSKQFLQTHLQRSWGVSRSIRRLYPPKTVRSDQTLGKLWRDNFFENFKKNWCFWVFGEKIFLQIFEKNQKLKVAKIFFHNKMIVEGKILLPSNDFGAFMPGAAGSSLLVILGTKRVSVNPKDSFNLHELPSVIPPRPPNQTRRSWGYRAHRFLVGCLQSVAVHQDLQNAIAARKEILAKNSSIQNDKTQDWYQNCCEYAIGALLLWWLCILGTKAGFSVICKYIYYRLEVRAVLHCFYLN